MKTMTDRQFRSRARGVAKRGISIAPSEREFGETNVKCPRYPKCDKTVVYNGNYFCECGWACPEIGPWNTQAQKEYLAELSAGLAKTRGET